jgi:hypothetical protein
MVNWQQNFGKVLRLGKIGSGFEKGVGSYGRYKYGSLHLSGLACFFIQTQKQSYKSTSTLPFQIPITLYASRNMSPTPSFFAPHAAPDDAEDPPRDTGEIHCTLSWQRRNPPYSLDGHNQHFRPFAQSLAHLWNNTRPHQRPFGHLLTANLSRADYGSWAFEALARRHGVVGNPVEEGNVALVAGIVYSYGKLNKFVE